jgi:hypothetical protein
VNQIKLHSTDSANIKINFVDRAGAAVNVSGVTTTFLIAEHLHETALVSKVSPINFTATTTAIVTLLPSETHYDGHYFYEVVFTDSDGSQFTGAVGEILFTRLAISDDLPIIAIFDAAAMAGGVLAGFDFSVSNNSVFALFLLGEDGL